MSNISPTRYFLWMLIAALCASAAVGIFIFLFGEFGDTEERILATTLSIGGFSLTSLCAVTVYTRAALKPLSLAGVIASGLGLITAISLIWELAEFEDEWKVLLILIILSVAIAHAALLLLIKPSSGLVRNVLVTTLGFVAIVSGMLIYAVITGKDHEFFFRLLGVFAILDVLGTISVPVLNRIAGGR